MFLYLKLKRIDHFARLNMCLFKTMAQDAIINSNLKKAKLGRQSLNTKQKRKVKTIGSQENKKSESNRKTTFTRGKQ